MSVTKELKNELGDTFLEVRGRDPQDASVTLYEIQNQGHEGAFWPWATNRKGAYDTKTVKIAHDLKRCLLKQEPYEKHADGKHRVYTVDGDVDTIMRIRKARKEGITLSNLFSQFETVKEELETVKDNLERPLLAAAMDLPATKIHETQERTVTSLCRMIAAEDAEEAAPEVYDRLLEESEKFRRKHKDLQKALEEKVDLLRKAVDFMEECEKGGGGLK